MTIDLLSIIQNVCEDKKIEQTEVLNAIKNALLSIAREFYVKKDIIIKSKTGTNEFELFEKLIVSNDKDDTNSISLEEALKIDKNAEIGSIIYVNLPQAPLNNRTAHKLKNLIFDQIKCAEKEREYNEFLNLKDKIVEGKVKKIAPNYLLVNVSKIGDAILFKNQMLPFDFYNIDDTILTILSNVKRSDKDYQAELSRTSSAFIEQLLHYFIPEIQNETLSIKSCARFPGSRCKVAVKSNDPRIEPISACVSKINKIKEELKGEKINFVIWDSNPLKFARNAVQPIKPYIVELAEDGLSIDIAVEDNAELSFLIGAGGKNIKLISRLLSYNINAMDTATYKEIKGNKIQKNISKLMKELDIDESIASVLVKNNLDTSAIISNTDIAKLNLIEGFSNGLSEEIKDRAIEAMQIKIEKNKKLINELKISEDLLSLNGIDTEIAIELAKKEINTAEKLAELSIDELKALEIEIINESCGRKIILSARDLVYKN